MSDYLYISFLIWSHIDNYRKYVLGSSETRKRVPPAIAKKISNSKQWVLFNV